LIIKKFLRNGEPGKKDANCRQPLSIRDLSTVGEDLLLKPAVLNQF